RVDAVREHADAHATPVDAQRADLIRAVRDVALRIDRAGERRNKISPAGVETGFDGRIGPLRDEWERPAQLFADALGALGARRAWNGSRPALAGRRSPGGFAVGHSFIRRANEFDLVQPGDRFERVQRQFRANRVELLVRGNDFTARLPDRFKDFRRHFSPDVEERSAVRAFLHSDGEIFNTGRDLTATFLFEPVEQLRINLLLLRRPRFLLLHQRLDLAQRALADSCLLLSLRGDASRNETRQWR